MESSATSGMQAKSGARSDDRLRGALDAQFAGLLETVWSCERQWMVDDHIDTVIKYGRQ